MIIGVFSARLLGRPDIARRVGLVSFLAVVPLTYLLVQAFAAGRAPIYFLWLFLMAVFLCAELLVDHILRLDFRSIRWATILYVIVFFAATGGMIGVASQAGRWWTAGTVVTFFVMAVLSFVQRARTAL